MAPPECDVADLEVPWNINAKTREKGHNQLHGSFCRSQFKRQRENILHETYAKSHCLGIVHQSQESSKKLIPGTSSSGLRAKSPSARKSVRPLRARALHLGNSKCPKFKRGLSDYPDTSSYSNTLTNIGRANPILLCLSREACFNFEWC